MPVRPGYQDTPFEFAKLEELLARSQKPITERLDKLIELEEKQASLLKAILERQSV